MLLARWRRQVAAGIWWRAANMIFAFFPCETAEGETLVDGERAGVGSAGARTAEDACDPSAGAVALVSARVLE